ncbi:MAG: cytochrome ubiquinol oxidase subunit I [Verrucomicrobia bacterium]|nr:cytochrome ubiquinol oxidase subunit I [Verrucomicrobiota bacterium]
MDAVLLARIQFALTIGFHFLFPPITIGLAWVLVIVEGLGWRRSDEDFVRMGRFLGKLLALTFAVGVATGIVMEFQFGTNWSEYSKFVGDIFGAPLAAEGVFAFFLESGFLGLYLFGRKRVSKGVHWFSILMVAVGSTISAFWILVANSWMQTPAGYVIQNGRAELTSFSEAVFNPSMWPRFFHTIDAALVSGAFFAAGVCAFLLLRNAQNRAALKALKTVLVVGIISSVTVVFPFGDMHARQVAHTQPEKFAAIEGLYSTQSGAPLAVFGLVKTRPPELNAKIELPGLLSLMAFGDIDAEIPGISEFPEDERPPLWLTFVSFHNMVLLGLFFIASMSWGALQIVRKRLPESRRFLKLLVCSIPLPLIACQFGWVAAEVGRQPWIVYHMLRTRDAVSVTVPAGQILATIIMFGVIYIFLGSLYVFLLIKEMKHEAESVTVKEVA